MTCPNCRAKNIDRNKKCPSCGINPVTFATTTRLSNSFYNKGLGFAKDNNLTSAIDCLRKSVDFDKHNYYARNLLGLIYFEIGQIGDALKQWIISSSFTKDSANLAIKYMEIVQDNQEELYKLNDAIVDFNQAVGYAVQENEDYAIIQLKKALETNPNFLQAMNLLAYCHLMSLKKSEAAPLVAKVLKVDKGNEIALEYYKLIHGKTPVKPKPANKVEPVQITKSISRTYTTVDEPIRGSRVFNFSHVASFVIGTILTAVLLYIFVMPAMVRDRDFTIEDLGHILSSERQNHSEQIQSLNMTIQTQETSINSLTETNTELSRQINLAVQSTAVQNASELFAAGNSTEAANVLDMLNFNDMPEDVFEVANALRGQIFPIAAQQFYNSALAQFNSGNYENARTQFLRSLELAPDAAIYIDDTIYFLGRIAMEQEQPDRAIQYFERLLLEFPSSNMASAANSRLNELLAED